MTMTPEIKMLGWENNLARSGAKLVYAHLASGEARGDCAVLLPGRRFRRHFQSALLDSSIDSGSGRALESPQLLTASDLVEAFLDSDSALRPVDDSVSLLFWAEAFRTLGRDAALLLGRGSEDSLALTRVATLRQVCEELDAIGFAPEDVLGNDFEVGSDDRWKALGALRHRAHDLLRASGLVEKTFERRQIIKQGVLRSDAPEILFVVGVTDPGPLTLALMTRFSDRIRILLEGPQNSRDDFDDYGRPLPEVWLSRPSVVPQGAMSLVDRPIDAAEVVLEQLAFASQKSSLDASDFVIGLCDERQAGVLERCGRRAGVPLRAAAGSALSNGEVARVLHGFSTYLRAPDIETFSELIRLPSLERVLCHESADDPVHRLDSWRERRIGGTLEDLMTLSSGDDEGRDDVLQGALSSLNLMLFPLNEARDIPGQMLATGTLLRTIFDPVRTEEGVSRSLDAIEALIATLSSCDGLPFVSPAAFFDLLSRTLKSLRRPAPPIDSDRGAIEMLGWLDVRNDPASNIILVGFNDSGELGPASSDGWLTQTLRGSLGLPTEEIRRARDAHAMHAIAARTENLHVIVTRHDHRGDPVVPSRLFLGCGGDESARRVMATMSEIPRSFPAHLLIGTASPASKPAFDTPKMPVHDFIERLRVTDFASWIRSPKRFWLERFKKLRTIESNHLELDARSFGKLAHDVLECFGLSALKNSTDEPRIIALMESDLDDLVAQRFGRPCTPAIEIQRRMLRDRLRRFAVIQARDAAEGWRCHSVEQSLECPLDIPGDVPVTLVGRVDRIDRHEDGRWRVLDYKTSEQAVTASSKRDSKGVWNDLQLPLYDHLMRRTVAGPDAVIELGYVSLPRDLLKVDFSVATEWDSEIIESGIELARTIVREMRSADFSRPPRGRSFGQEVDGIDRILRSSVLVTGEDDEEESES